MASRRVSDRRDPLPLDEPAEGHQINAKRCRAEAQSTPEGRVRTVGAQRRALTLPRARRHALLRDGEVGERLKNYQKAWSTLRLRAIGHGPHWGPNGRFLPCCREHLAKMNRHMHDLRREAGSRLLERGADLHRVQLFLDHAIISTSSRDLKPSKLALHTTIQRIDAQRRESGEAAKWEQDLAELRKNLQQGPQKGPHADRIVRQREVGKPTY